MVSIYYYYYYFLLCTNLEQSRSEILMYFSLAVLDNEFRLLLLHLCCLWVCFLDGSHGLMPEDLLPVLTVTNFSLAKLESRTHLRNPSQIDSSISEKLSLRRFTFTCQFSDLALGKPELRPETF